MADTHETTADIIAEKRRQADEIERDCAEKMKRGEMVSDCYARELVADIRCEADRLDAAHRREVDALKQRLAEMDAEVAAKDEVIKRLNDAIAEEQKRHLATTENSSAVGDCAKLREASGNTTALREALKQAKEIARTIYSTSSKGSFHEDLAEKIVELAQAALAEPPRNCDVGTAEEQLERLNAYCKKCDGCMSYTRPELLDEVCLCALKWAQMPYEEGGAK